MLKKIFWILIGFFILMFTSAQIGINLETPQGVFHVDSKGDTNGINNISDDVIITNNGSIGIGTISPNEKLHVIGQSLTTGNTEIGNTLTIGGNGLIKGSLAVNGTHIPEATVHVKNSSYSMKIESAHYAPGKYLTTDADGYASWKKLLSNSEVVGLNIPLYSSAKQINGMGYFNITDNPLTLSKGVWLIIARYGTRATSTSSTTAYRVNNPIWTKLEMNSGLGWTEVITNATVAEVGQTSAPTASRYKTAIPQLIHVFNIEQDNTNIRISAYLNYGHAYQTVPLSDTNTYIPGFTPIFIAIKLNDTPL